MVALKEDSNLENSLKNAQSTSSFDKAGNESPEPVSKKQKLDDEQSKISGDEVEVKNQPNSSDQNSLSNKMIDSLICSICSEIMHECVW